MLERENAIRQVSLKGNVPIKQCSRFKQQYELSMTCRLGRNLQIELFESLSKTGGSIESLGEAVANLAEDVSDLESRQRELVEDVKDFRKRLSRGLSAL